MSTETIVCESLRPLNVRILTRDMSLHKRGISGYTSCSLSSFLTPAWEAPLSLESCKKRPPFLVCCLSLVLGLQPPQGPSQAVVRLPVHGVNNDSENSLPLTTHLSVPLEPTCETFQYGVVRFSVSHVGF